MNTQSRSNKIKLPFLKYAVDRTITAAYCLSTLYNVAFFSQMFLLAFISKDVKCSDKTFGYIETLFGLLQMAGGPLFGYIIQIYGPEML
uniref:Uncharacterized protein n=1 Tax=Ditylenchus dipsaci TaxID=166011 RepID=A0A915DX00_9BILA